MSDKITTSGWSQSQIPAFKVGDKFTIAGRYVVRPEWWRRLLRFLGWRNKTSRLQVYSITQECSSHQVYVETNT